MLHEIHTVSCAIPRKSQRRVRSSLSSTSTPNMSDHGNGLHANSRPRSDQRISRTLPSCHPWGARDKRSHVSSLRLNTSYITRKVIILLVNTSRNWPSKRYNDVLPRHARGYGYSISVYWCTGIVDSKSPWINSHVPPLATKTVSSLGHIAGSVVDHHQPQSSEKKCGECLGVHISHIASTHPKDELDSYVHTTLIGIRSDTLPIGIWPYGFITKISIFTNRSDRPSRCRSKWRPGSFSRTENINTLSRRTPHSSTRCYSD
jgi:hypothetical protein